MSPLAVARVTVSRTALCQQRPLATRVANLQPAREIVLRSAPRTGPLSVRSIAQLQDLALLAVRRSNDLASPCLSLRPVVRLVFAALEEALHLFARAPVRVSDV